MYYILFDCSNIWSWVIRYIDLLDMIDIIDDMDHCHSLFFPKYVCMYFSFSFLKTINAPDKLKFCLLYPLIMNNQLLRSSVKRF